MNPKIKELLKSIKAKKVGLFIDNANWFYPQRELGWKISFSKLRKLFESYCDLVVLRIYAGTPLNDHDKKNF